MRDVWWVRGKDLQFVFEPTPKAKVLVATKNLVFDESGKRADSDCVVWAGIIIESALHWDEFSQHWLAILKGAGISAFHANQAFTFGGDWKQFRRGRAHERDAILRSLANLWPRYALEVFGAVLPVAEFKQWDQLTRERYRNDPFYCLFDKGLQAVVSSAKVSPDDNFNLICDDSEETAAECLKVFRRLKRDYPRIGERLGTICFGDDEKVIPLQLADMYAYVLRRKAENADPGVWEEVYDIFMAPDPNSDVIVKPIYVAPESSVSLWFRRLRFIFRQGRHLLRRR